MVRNELLKLMEEFSESEVIEGVIREYDRLIKGDADIYSKDNEFISLVILMAHIDEIHDKLIRILKKLKNKTIKEGRNEILHL